MKMNEWNLFNIENKIYTLEGLSDFMLKVVYELRILLFHINSTSKIENERALLKWNA